MIQTYKAHLIEKQQMSPDVFMFRFQLPEGQNVEFVPGQYLILFVPQGQTKARRLFSINTPPKKDGTFELLVKIIPGGVASEYVSRLTKEEEVLFQGPAGMFQLRPRQKNIVFMATGTGLAPIRSILLSMANSQWLIANGQQIRTDLFWGLRTSQDAYYLDEFETLKKQFSGFSYNLCFSRDEQFEKIPQEQKSVCITGRIPDAMEKIANNTNLKIDNASDYYLCGGRDAVETFRHYLYGRGIEKENVFFEKF